MSQGLMSMDDRLRAIEPLLKWCIARCRSRMKGKGRVRVWPEELYEAGLVGAWRAMKSGVVMKCESKFLATAMLNEMRDYLQSEGFVKAGGAKRKRWSWSESNQAVGVFEDRGGVAPSPWQAFLMRAVLEEVSSWSGGLTARVVDCRYRQGKSVSETAAALGLSEDWVKKLDTRILGLARERYHVVEDQARADRLHQLAIDRGWVKASADEQKSRWAVAYRQRADVREQRRLEKERRRRRLGVPQRSRSVDVSSMRILDEVSSGPAVEMAGAS